MSLAEHVPTRAQHGLPCPIATLLTELPESEADALRTMLDAPWRVWGHQAIERVLLAEGHECGTGSVGKHRRLACRCKRDQA